MDKRNKPPRKCSVPGCWRMQRAKGLCNAHYQRQWTEERNEQFEKLKAKEAVQ